MVSNEYNIEPQNQVSMIISQLSEQLTLYRSHSYSYTAWVHSFKFPMIDKCKSIKAWSAMVQKCVIQRILSKPITE
jgi:hypothetical protein